MKTNMEWREAYLTMPGYKVLWVTWQDEKNGRHAVTSPVIQPNDPPELVAEILQGVACQIFKRCALQRD